MSDADPITSLGMLLAECNLAHLSENLANETLAIAEQDRSALLSTLKADGVAKLSDRQAAANAISKAKKAGRLQVGGPLDTPLASSGEEVSVKFARPSTEPLTRKPKIALLHGGATNSKILEHQLAPLLSRLKGEVELRHIEGGLPAPADNPMVKAMKQYFGPMADNLLGYAETAHDANGWWTYPTTADAAIRVIERKLESAGDCDFILGFSQGANFAVMVAARAVLALPGARPPFRGLIVLEADLPGWVADQPALFHKLPLPIPAIVVGATKHAPHPADSPAPPAGPAAPEVIDTASDEVAKLLESPLMCKFAEGHRPLPADKARAAEIVEEIRKFVLERCATGASTPEPITLT